MPPMVALCAGKGPSLLINSMRWILDSGASHHMCPDRAAFREYKKMELGDSRAVAVASGDSIKVVGMGTIELAFPVEGKTETLSLVNALHVPGLAVNLISVPVLQVQDVPVLFTREGAIIYTKHNEIHAKLDDDHKATVIQVPVRGPTTYSVRDGGVGSQPLLPRATDADALPRDPATDGGEGTTVVAGRVGNDTDEIGVGSGPVMTVGTDTDRSGGMPIGSASVDPGAEEGWADGPTQTGVSVEASGKHPVDAERTVKFTVQVARGKHGKYLLWHRRIAHSGNECLASLAKQDKIKELSESQVRSLGKHMQTCDTCVETKLSRTRFSKRSKRRTKTPNELVLVDIVGQFTEIAGFQYFLTIVEAYSRRNWVFPLKTKAEAFPILRDHCGYMERKQGQKVRTIRSDNGGEFTSNVAKDWAKKEGIKWEYTTPYTSIQNGIAERMNRTIQDKARAMLHAAGVSHEYWPSAMQAASYLINHLPTKSLGGKIPEERWEGRKLDLSHLRVWGCVAWIKVHDQQRSDGKLSDRGLRGMFIGYAEDRKAWMVLTPSHPTKKLHYSRDVRFDEGTRFVDTVLSAKNPMMPAAFSYEDMLDMEWNDPHTPEFTVIDSELPSVSETSSQHDVLANIPESIGSDTGWQQMDAPRSSTPQLAPLSPSLLDIDLLLSPREILATPLPDESLDIPSMRSPTPLRSAKLPRLKPPDPPAVPPAPPTGSSKRVGPMTERELRAEARHFKRFARPLSPGFHALAVTFQESEQMRVSADGQELEPATYAEAKRRLDWGKWNKAMDEQMEALVGMHTWDVVELPPGRKAIGSRWVYKLKLDEDGVAHRWKARLVAQGFTQVAGVDYFETFAPVARLDSLRVILALAAHFDWVIHQVDVVTAYLNGDLEEEVYIRQPPGYEKGDSRRNNMVCRLRLPLYGLKQSGRQWNCDGGVEYADECCGGRGQPVAGNGSDSNG
ncbi:hypothetical protein CF326_g7860, partial [Tilletia indica]